MIKKFFIFTASLGMCYLGLSSYSAGLGTMSINRTGSDGASATCAGSGCHGASSTATQIFIEIKEKITGITVSGNYIPGKLYTVRLYGECNIPPLRPKFGFQATVVKNDKSPSGNLRKITGTNTDIHTFSGQNIIEHSSPLDATPSPGFYSVLFEWIAPPKGSGKANFYGILNAVDGSGTTDKDLPSLGIIASLEEGTLTNIDESRALRNLSIYPNPCVNQLNIISEKNIEYNTAIYDIAGRQFDAPKQQNVIDVSSLVPGVYFLRITSKGENQIINFIKN